MQRINRQIFVFLIPTLIVAVIFISLNQQSTFIADDSDSNAGLTKIEVPTKHLGFGSLLVSPNVFVSVERGMLPVFFVIGSALILIFLLNSDNKLCNIKNHSPPAGKLV